MTLFAAASPNVSLIAEPIFHLGPFAISNSMLLGVVGIVLLFWLLLYTVRCSVRGHHTRLSIGVLWMYEVLLGTIEEVIGDRQRARRLGPLAITMFFLIIINNWLEILPFVGPLTWHGSPFFRGLAADLNFTFALAIITMVTAQIWGIRAHGFGGNLRRYIGNPFRDPLHAFEGFLELIAEFSRTVALSMRLFGNIFGGEVLLAVIGFITSWASPLTLPVFMFLELFVGAIQAYVFFMLTVVFISLAASGHTEETAHPVASTIVAPESA